MAVTSETRGELNVAEPVPMPNIELWRPNQLQLIVFPTVAPANVDENWWRQATGREPAESTKKRTETTIAGPYGDANLVLTADLFRVVWTLMPQLDPLNPPMSLPSLGAYPAARDIFAGLVSAWITGYCPQIKRMAFTGLLIQEAASHEDAYRLLQRYLQPTLRIDPESTDLIYRINRPRCSKAVTFDLRINRLSTWSAAKFSVSARAHLPGPENQDIPLWPSTTGYGVMLQFDVNTDAEWIKEIPRERIGPLFDELLELAIEIAKHGDVS
jgi:hypothetical protein